MTHVVVAIISRINKKQEKEFLLVSSQKDFGAFTGFYYPPSGHVEEGENEIDALKREVHEELQLTVTSAEKITTTHGDIPSQKTSWYLCEVESDNFIIDHSELRDAHFFTVQVMHNLNIWPATKKIFEKYF